MTRKEIEPGVYVTEPPERAHWHAEASPMTTYKLREMTPEAIERYGLKRYLRRCSDGNAET